MTYIKSIAFLPLLAVAFLGAAGLFVSPAKAETPPPGTCEETDPVRLPGNRAVYPEELLQQDIQGDVVLTYDVTPQGNVENTKVAQSSGNEALDQATVEIVEKWKFSPGTSCGKPVRKTNLYKWEWRIPPNDLPERLKKVDSFWNQGDMAATRAELLDVIYHPLFQLQGRPVIVGAFELLSLVSVELNGVDAAVAVLNKRRVNPLPPFDKSIVYQYAIAKGLNLKRYDIAAKALSGLLENNPADVSKIPDDKIDLLRNFAARDAAQKTRLEAALKKAGYTN